MSCNNPIVASFLLINLTPFPWTESAGSGTPGVTRLQSPPTVEPATFRPYQWSACPESNGVYASATTSWTVGPGANASLELAISGQASYEVPSYTVTGLDLLGNPSGTQESLSRGRIMNDDNSNYWAPVILSGATGGPWVSSRPPMDWMQQSLPYLGCRMLKELVLPASHDSGMSIVENPTFGVTVENTKTQSQTIGSQLSSGIRNFDIRPSIKNGEFLTAHWSKVTEAVIAAEILLFQEPADTLGGTGQSIVDIISEVNAFTSGNQELVILDFSAFLDWDRTVPGEPFYGFVDADYDRFLQLLAGINNLWTASEAPDFVTTTLSTLITGRAAVILLFENGMQEHLVRNNLLYQGFFLKSQSMRTSGSYAKADNVDAMRQDQYDKFTTFANDAANENTLFELSWTFTLPDAAFVGDFLAGGLYNPSLERAAQDFNDQLTNPGFPGSQVWQETWLSWFTNNRYPNKILIDFVPVFNNHAAMCLAASRFWAQDSCYVPPADNPDNGSSNSTVAPPPGSQSTNVAPPGGQSTGAAPPPGGQSTNAAPPGPQTSYASNSGWQQWTTFVTSTVPAQATWGKW